MKNLQKRLAELEKRMDGMDSCLSVQNSSIRTVSDCLEHAKVTLHEKINDFRTEVEGDMSEDSFIRAELSERVGDLDYKLDEVEGTIRGYNKRDTDMIELMLLNIDKAKFTAAVNKATILAFGGPNNDSAKVTMDRIETAIKKDWNEKSKRKT